MDLPLLFDTTESPAQTWPDIFGKLPLFVNYPYLLPTSNAASVTMTNESPLPAVFLHAHTNIATRCSPAPLPWSRRWHTRGCHLSPEKITDATHLTIPEEESLPSGPIATVSRKASLYDGLRKASRTFSGVFVSRVPEPTSPIPLSSFSVSLRKSTFPSY